jgi:cytosine/adenosine deaminase-related metal-dependent hydrolase
MTHNYFSADRILAARGEWKENQVIVTDGEGRIAEIKDNKHFPSADIQRYQGAIIPGFINANCHLELSHMKCRIPTGTGLISFIQAVVTQRDIEAETIQNAIAAADAEMHKAGIMAVGDISNVSDSFQQKQKSQLRYYTFVEVFDFMQNNLCESSFQKAMDIFETLTLPTGHEKSLVPHAPYSVSQELFKKIKSFYSRGRVLSLHNQEIKDEDDMFISGQGGLIPFFESFGFDMSHFQITGESSLRYALPQLPDQAPLLLVHNTRTLSEDIQWAEKNNSNLYWVSCPNANLYIENQLPQYDTFRDLNARIALGTDSLASNWQLSILDEIKTLRKYKSYLPTLELLSWATINGAQALQMEDQLGSLEVGKCPGILQLDLREENQWEVQADTRCQRLI